MKHKILVIISLIMLLGLHVEAQQLRGRVMLNEVVPAQFATVYLSSSGIGTISDAEGYYSLDGLPPHNAKVEFSHIGYLTHVAVADTLVEGDSLRTIVLQEQAIALNEVFITPNGEDPAAYIFRRVHERAKQNQKRLQYDAEISASILAQDMDVIPLVLPKFVLWIVRNALRLTSIGGIFDFVIRHERVQAKGTVLCHSRNGKCKFDGWKMTQSTHRDKDLDQSFRKVSSADPFEFLYDRFLSARNLPEGYQLKGTIVEDGKTIDVLYKVRIRKSEEDKFRADTAFIYVVEDDWGILREEYHPSDEVLRLECRDIGNGIWMPISFVGELKSVDLNQAIREAFEKDSLENLSRKEQKTMNRLMNVANGKRQFNPAASVCYSVKYTPK